MSTPLTCTEPLVWTCKACGHSFHAEEWQSHGRQCPACTEKGGEWKCSLCLGSFTQPALQGPHPCKKAGSICSKGIWSRTKTPRFFPRIRDFLDLNLNKVLVFGGFFLLFLTAGLFFLLNTYYLPHRDLSSLKKRTQLLLEGSKLYSDGFLPQAEKRFKALAWQCKDLPEWALTLTLLQFYINIELKNRPRADLLLQEANSLLKRFPDQPGNDFFSLSLKTAERRFRSATTSSDNEKVLVNYYTEIFRIIAQADSLLKSGSVIQAAKQYEKAVLQLEVFRLQNYQWEPDIISYRLAYLYTQILALGFLKKTSEISLFEAANSYASFLQKEEIAYQKAFVLLRTTKAYQVFLEEYEDFLAKKGLTWHPAFSTEGSDIVMIEIRTDLENHSVPQKFFKVNLSTETCYEYEITTDSLIKIK